MNNKRGQTAILFAIFVILFVGGLFLLINSSQEDELSTLEPVTAEQILCVRDIAQAECEKFDLGNANIKDSDARIAINEVQDGKPLGQLECLKRGYGTSINFPSIDECT